jgi:hypothetical protein
MPRQPELIIRELEDELVIMDPRTEQVYVLNATASAIWELCQAGLNVEEIVQELVQTIGADPARAKQEVSHLLATWAEQGLLNSGTGL